MSGEWRHWPRWRSLAPSLVPVFLATAATGGRAQLDPSAAWSYQAHIQAARASLAEGRPGDAKHHLSMAAGPSAGWEWHYLQGQASRSLVHIPGNAYRIAVHPTRPWVAFPHGGGVEIYDWQDGRLQRTLDAMFRSAIADLAWLSGDRLRVIHWECNATVTWDAQTGEVLAKSSGGVPGDMPFYALVRSPVRAEYLESHGSRVQTCGSERIEWWLDLSSRGLQALADGKVTLTPEESANGTAATALAFSMDGDACAAGLEGGIMVVEHRKSGDRGIHRICNAEITSLDFAPDGEQLLVAAADQVIRLLHWRSGEVREVHRHAPAWQSEGLAAIKPRYKRVFTLDLHPVARFGVGGKEILSIGEDGVLRIATSNGQPLLAQPAHDVRASALELSPEGDCVLTGARDGVRVWPTDLGRQSRGHYFPPGIRGLTLHPQGDRMLLTTRQGGFVEYWLDSGRLTGRPLPSRTPHFMAVAYVEGGRTLVHTAADDLFRIGGADPKLMPSIRPASLAAHPDGQRIGVGGADGQVSLVDSRRMEDIGSAKLDSSKLRARGMGRRTPVAFTGDGSLLCVAHADEVAWFRVNGSFESAGRAVIGADAASDVFTLAVHPSRPVAVVGFRYEPRLLRIDLESGKTRALPILQSGGVHALAFDATGSRLASGAADGSVVVWDFLHEQPLLRFKDHLEPVVGIAFSHDGTRLISACEDGTLRIYDSDLRRACRFRLSPP